MSTQDPIERLVSAYDQLLEGLHEELHEKEEQLREGLSQSINTAARNLVEFGEFSREEAQQALAYLSRDLHDLGQHLKEEESSLASWFRFDVEQIEERVWQLIKSVADKTTLELELLKLQAAENDLYHTHEVTGPGTLVCVNCGEQIRFRKTAAIPSCKACGQQRFTRLRAIL